MTGDDRRQDDREDQALTEAIAAVSASIADGGDMPELWADIADRSVAGREPGRHIGDPPPLSGAHCRRRLTDALLSLADSLDDSQLAATTVYGTSVAELLRHLAASEQALAASVADGASGTWASPWAADHLALRDATDAGPADILRTRSLEFDAALVAAANLDEHDAALTTRAFEVWTHADDIRRAIGAPLVAPDPEVVRAMADLAIALTIPLAADDRHPEATMRITLTGPGGGSWVRRLRDGQDTAGPSASGVATDAHAIADVVDYCRLAAARLDPADVLIDSAGDRVLIDRLLANAASLADFGAGAPG